MSNLQTMAIIFICVFLAFLIGVGIWSSRKNKQGASAENVEYFLGGKTTPMFVLAMSYCASAVSAGSFIGDPGLMSTIGWPYYWIVLSVVPGLVIPGLFIIRKMRLQAQKYGSMTVVEYIGDRFHSKALKTYLDILIVLCFLFTLVAQFKGAAVLLNMYTGVPFKAGLIIMMVVVVFYVNMGGLRSVAWTDCFQGCFMVVMSFMLIIVAINAVGGFSGMEAAFDATNPSFNRLVEEGGEADVTVTILGASTIILYGAFNMFSQPYIAARYLALPDINKKNIGKFLLISLFTGVLFNLVFLVGPAGRILFPNAEADYMTVTVSSNLLSPIFACIVMIGFFSAIVSTATSILLVMGQSIGADLYGKYAKNSTPKKEVRVTQIATIVIALIVLAFDLSKPPEFLQIFIYLGLTGVASALCMPLYCGVLWKKATKAGAITSAIVGPASYLVWNVLLGYSWFTGMNLAIIAAAAGMFIVSWIVNAIKGPDKQLMDWADPFVDAPKLD